MGGPQKSIGGAGGFLKYTVGLAAQELGKRLVPNVLTIGGVQVLQPMGRVATEVGPVARWVGRWGTSVSPLLPLTLVAFNPTNRFPGSSSEREMVRRGLEAQHRQELACQRNDELLRQLAQQRLKADAQQRQQAEVMQRQQAQSPRKAQQRTLQLQLRTPTVWNSAVMSAARVDPMRLRPPPKIDTPFNLRLMRPSPAGNPFDLSVMGRQTSASFGRNLGTPQLRAPMIER